VSPARKAPAPARPPPASQTIFAGDSPVPFDAVAAVDHLRQADRVLGKLIDAVGPCRLRPDGEQPPFQALTESVLHQQVTGKAAAAILARFRAAFGQGGAFPAPSRVVVATDEELRASGVSRTKAAALRDLAAKVLDGTVPGAQALHALEDAAVIDRLTRVRGIGVWTVQMLLIFRLGRPDVLPAGDYGVRKGFKKTFRTRGELPTPGDIEKRGERWRPYRTVAAWYLWRALELP
jgi:3-methyladenine DNA glycosylase/8-oxoguanine DNA glycosylase